MTLDISKYAHNIKQQKELQTKAYQLAKQELIDSIDDIPVSEFDKQLDPVIKKHINKYYNYKYNPNYNSKDEDPFIMLYKGDIENIYNNYYKNDLSAIQKCHDTKYQLTNVLTGPDEEYDIICSRLTKRLANHLKTNPSLDINTDTESFDYDDLQRGLKMIITIKLPN